MRILPFLLAILALAASAQPEVGARQPEVGTSQPEPRTGQPEVGTSQPALRTDQPALRTDTPAPPDSTRALRQVVVTATRLPMLAHDAPARITRLDADDAESAGATSVADLLDARAPVTLRRNGPTGLATLSLRGAGSAQTLVLLDGVPLGSPALGVVDLSLLPTALLSSAEVLSGGASGLWGSRAVGGVVALTSGGATGGGVEAGAWGARRAWARGAVRTDGANVLIAAETDESTNDYRATIGGQTAPRLGWDARRQTGLVSVASGRGPTQARLTAWGATAERGLGGDSTGSALVGQRQWDDTARLAASVRSVIGRFALDATVGADASRLRWAAPFPDLGRPDAIDETGRTRALHADLRATTSTAGGSWTLGLAGGRATARHPSLAADAADTFVAAAASGIYVNGCFRLYPAIRTDHYVAAGRTAQTAVSPHLGLNVALSPSWNARASAGRAFRMPTLNDRFWSPGGAPDLRPERAWSADAGLVRTHPTLDAEVSVFARTGRDEIVWLPGAGGLWSPENIARTGVFGTEASVNARRRFGAVRLDGGGIATLLHARDLSSGQPLRYQPAWTARVWASASRGGLRADLGVRAVGPRPTTASGSLPLPPHAVVDASLRAERVVGRAVVGVGVTIENLLDARYESVRLVPMPPRHARVRLTVTTR